VETAPFRFPTIADGKGALDKNNKKNCAQVHFLPQQTNKHTRKNANHLSVDGRIILKWFLDK
jgi:hypothetical protein